ncbi:hypothetical protein AGR4B_pAt20538 [Agrobacterium tumefaciens str. CFBP 5621]|nr:hypothetical protein AGR4B_pAt20538 [Agrobacterium tumefaciens str. CFBP 5621]
MWKSQPGLPWPPLPEPAGVSEEVDLPGDRSQQFPQAIFLQLVEAKSQRKLTDVPGFFFSRSTVFTGSNRILHDEILW